MCYPGKLLISMGKVHSRNTKVIKIRKWTKLKQQWVMQKCWTELLMNFRDWDLTRLQKQGINATAGSMMGTLWNSLDDTAQLKSRKTRSKQVLTWRLFKVIGVTETVFHTNGNYKSLTSLVQQNEGGRDCLSTNCVHMREEEEVFNLKKNHNRMGANWYELTLINRTTKKKLYKWSSSPTRYSWQTSRLFLRQFEHNLRYSVLWRVAKRSPDGLSLCCD